MSITFAQISDLHFGTVEDDLRDRLLHSLQDQNLDFLIASGDFTQIAAPDEFRAARAFIDRFDCPVLCVPGNHDVPPRNVFERLLTPYRRYKKYISPDLSFTFRRDTIAVCGINTARRALPHWNWANGAISKGQVAALHDFFSAQEPGCLKILVCHHPLVPVPGAMRSKVFGGRAALDALSHLQVDLVMTGHVHHSSILTLDAADDRMLLIGASTALSSRIRRHKNGYNLLTFDPVKMEVEITVMGWSGADFVPERTVIQPVTLD